jgi:hypothetical protein
MRPTASTASGVALSVEALRINSFGQPGSVHMGYALLWIEALVSALLWMALVAACVARIKWRRVRGVLMLLAELPVLLFTAWLCGVLGMRYVANVESNRPVFAVILWIGTFVGMLVILIKARSPQAALAPKAATWRRGPLAVAWGMSIVLAATTLWNMDMAMRARADILAIEVDELWLATNPGVPSDAQNAAIFYHEALARLHDDPGKDVNDPPLGNGLAFDPKEPAMVAYLERQAPTLALLRKAAAMPGCRFDEDLPRSDFTQRMPNLAQERGAAYILSLDAQREVAQGHVSNAIADVDAVFKMSRHFAQRPTLIAGLVAVGVDALGANSLQDVLPAVTQAQELASLDIQSLPSLRRMFWRILQGEERVGVTTFNRLEQGEFSLADMGTNDGLPTQAAMGFGPVFRVLILPDELDVYIEFMERLKQAAPQPFFKVRQQLAEIAESYNPKRPHKGFLASILVPSEVKVFETFAKGEASDACTQVALAMTRYRLDHGNLPAHLSDLVPGYLDAIPLDPFDGQPLRMIVRDNQWIIYSIGTSGKDEGNNAMPDWKKGNVTFVLKASAPATRP